MMDERLGLLCLGAQAHNTAAARRRALAWPRPVTAIDVGRSAAPRNAVCRQIESRLTLMSAPDLIVESRKSDKLFASPEFQAHISNPDAACMSNQAERITQPRLVAARPAISTMT